MKKIYILPTVIFILLIGIGLFYFFSPEGSSLSNSQKQKAAVKILGRDVNLGSQQASSGVYNGKYMSFKYPNNAKPYTYNRANILKQPGVLESFQFESTTPKYFFNFQALDSSSTSNLSELSGVSLRESDTTKYKEDKSNPDRLRFEKENSDGTEISEFIKSNNKYFIFVISGGSIEDMKPVFDEVLTSATFSNN